MSTENVDQTKTKSSAGLVALAWLAVGIPLLFGIAQTVSKAAALFH
jgi:hypothetical protein